MGSRDEEHVSFAFGFLTVKTTKDNYRYPESSKIWKSRVPSFGNNIVTSGGRGQVIHVPGILL